MRAKLKEIKAQLRRRRHQPIPDQGRWLKQVVGGFFAYHAVPTNSRALGAFRHYVLRMWRETLLRRSQRDRTTWPRVKLVADAWLPQPIIRHPWPNQRFAVRHPMEEPYAGIPPVRVRAGRSAIGVPTVIRKRKPFTKAVIRPSTTARPTRRRSIPLDARWPQLWRPAPIRRRYPQTPSRLDRLVPRERGETARRTVYVNAQPSWAPAIGRPSRAIGRKSRTGGRVCHTRRADNRPCRA